MGFLTEDELSSLRIENMVLHTVSDGDFMPQPARQVEQADFFAERIRETDAAAVFSFEEKSLTKAQIELACCRFRGHRDKVFNGTGELECREGSSAASSSLRR